MNKNYVLYRLPRENEFTRMEQIKGEPTRLTSYSDIGTENGFVFAPFSVMDYLPIFLLKPDLIEHKHIACDYESACVNSINTPSLCSERKLYHDVFEKFHSKLVDGDFGKIVLSRCSELHIEGSITPEELFLNACKLYPRMFIALVSISEAGTWLMATPEILLDGHGTEWHTMALAGTMRLKDEQLSFDTPYCTLHEKEIIWSKKNICEQRYVSSYIEKSLSQFTDDIKESEPYTVRAGRLVHIRSDFDFRIKSSASIGRIIQELHPTPAVCGLPRNETYEFILCNEDYERKYYSGFSGIVDTNNRTSLFVTLRCMRLLGKNYELYAGGGLLADSNEDSEWAETEAKMETMRRCFVTKKI